jgi:hypothetical protein
MKGLTPIVQGAPPKALMRSTKRVLAPFLAAARAAPQPERPPPRTITSYFLLLIGIPPMYGLNLFVVFLFFEDKILDDHDDKAYAQGTYHTPKEPRGGSSLFRHLGSLRGGV